MNSINLLKYLSIYHSGPERLSHLHFTSVACQLKLLYYLWIVLRFFSPYSLARMKTTVLWRYLPQGWTGMEGGLLTTTRSSFLEMILISSDDTGTSCLNKEIFRMGKLSKKLSQILTIIKEKLYWLLELSEGLSLTNFLLIRFFDLWSSIWWRNWDVNCSQYL